MKVKPNQNEKEKEKEMTIQTTAAATTDTSFTSYEDVEAINAYVQSRRAAEGLMPGQQWENFGKFYLPVGQIVRVPLVRFTELASDSNGLKNLSGSYTAYGDLTLGENLVGLLDWTTGLKITNPGFIQVFVPGKSLAEFQAYIKDEIVTDLLLYARNGEVVRFEWAPTHSAIFNHLNTRASVSDIPVVLPVQAKATLDRPSAQKAASVNAQSGNNTLAYSAAAGGAQSGIAGLMAGWRLGR